MDLEDATSDDDLLLSSEEMSEGEPEEGTPCSASESDVASSAPSRWSRAASWRFWLSKLPCILLTSAHGVRVRHRNSALNFPCTEDERLPLRSEKETITAATVATLSVRERSVRSNITSARWHHTLDSSRIVAERPMFAN